MELSADLRQAGAAMSDSTHSTDAPSGGVKRDGVEVVLLFALVGLLLGQAVSLGLTIVGFAGIPATPPAPTAHHPAD